ncbi:MAG: hypothetical protein KAH57_08470, partial [Thermoplasmata archaeon]|nr:hypothetical protein [Thermoplasmata archaeon]
MSKGEREGETPSPPDEEKKEGPREEQPAAPPDGDEEAKGNKKAVESEAPSPRSKDGPVGDVPDPIKDQPKAEEAPKAEGDLPEKGENVGGDEGSTEREDEKKAKDPAETKPQTSDDKDKGG